MGTYYNGNTLDTTTKDQLTKTLINKIVKQICDTKVFGGVFDIFTKKYIGEEGFQIEEFEVGNLTATDFDPTGADVLNKANMNFKVLYHKKNRNKTFKVTISDKQIRNAMLSKENMALAAQAITNELFNSAAIDEYEAIKQLLVDICQDQKAMVICDLNDNANDMDAVVKAIQTIATNMTFPSTAYNYSGFKKEFNIKEDLVLIMDSTFKARLNVDSLASAFNMDKKALVENIVVVDKMPAISYSATKATKGEEIDIGETNPIITYKYKEDGDATVTGTAKCILVAKNALIVNPIDRDTDQARNAAGRFTNQYLFVGDLLSYSTLRNAVVLVD